MERWLNPRHRPITPLQPAHRTLTSNPKDPPEGRRRVSSTGLDREDLRAMLAAARHDGVWSEALITLLALNGLRIGEALSRDVGLLYHVVDVQR